VRHGSAAPTPALHGEKLARPTLRTGAHVLKCVNALRVSTGDDMEMKRINAGKLRAIGYDVRERILRVELDDGTAIDYAGVGNEVWRKLSTSASAWSYYRDNIEEEFSGKRGKAGAKQSRDALEALFKTGGGDE
jgi:hypothetical protein